MPAQITTRTLSCGMPLVVERIPGVRSASLQWLLPAGAGHDLPGRLGTAAMLDELLLRGAGGMSSRAFADEMDRLGILRGIDVGAQHLRIAASFVGARTSECLAPIVEMVRRPRFDADAIEPTRKLCLQTLAGLNDNPQERGGVLLSSRHNPTPLHQPIHGDEPGLNALTRDELADRWHTLAKPVGSVLALAGDVDADDAARTLDRLLAGWAGAAPSLALALNPARGSYHHAHDDSNQVQIYLAHESPSESHADARLERMVAAALAGGTSARLFTEVREKRALCYSVHAWYVADKQFGKSVGYVGTTPDKAQQSLDVFIEQLRTLAGASAAIKHDEFDRARVGFKSTLVSSGESSAARAAALAGDHHKLGRARSLDELVAEIERTTLDEVNAYARRRALGPITIVTLGPSALKPPG